MPYDVLSVANEFIKLAQKRRAVDPLKLQKLVYLAHGWDLALEDSSLIREPVEAWTYGPVVRRLYRYFKHLKSSPISDTAKDVPALPDGGAKSLIESVWNAYGKRTAIELSMLTHESGSAWDLIRRRAKEWEIPVIPNDLIKQEFLIRKEHGGHVR